MQFNNVGGTGIVQRCEALTLLGRTGISSNSNLLIDFTGHINQAYLEVVSALLKADKYWKIDDSNTYAGASGATYPEASISMVSSQRDYTLPVAYGGGHASSLLRINKVWALDVNGNRQELSLMNPSDDFDRDAIGLPSQYRLHGNSIYLDVRPDNGVSVTLTAGLIVLFQRSPDAFTTSDTSQQPFFMETHHELLPLKASSMYLMPTNQNLATQYFAQWSVMLKDLVESYAGRNDDVDRRMTFMNSGSGR